MKFGINKVNITPQYNLTMDGFFDRKDPSNGTLDCLYATAFVLESNNTKVAIVCVDILGVDMHLLERVQELVTNETTIPKQCIILNASHTHAAPAAARFGDMGNFFRKSNPSNEDLSYYNQLALKMAEAIIMANRSLLVGKILFTQTTIEGVSSNRVHPNKPHNQIASVFQFVDTNEKTVGLLTLFANHPTILGPNNQQYSNDFISYFHKTIESHLDGVTSGYLQGCAAEISSRFTKTSSSVEEAKRLGELLAQQVVDSMNASSIQLNDKLSVRTLPLHLLIRDFETPEFYQNQIKNAELDYDKLQKSSNDSKVLRSAYAILEGKKLIAIMQREIDIESIDTTMSHIQIGSVHLVTTPGETFGAIEQDIKALTNETIIVMGYTNGYIGYIPDEKSYSDLDIYEANMAPTSIKSHQLIIETAKKLLKFG